jgi:hypothetical protein
MIPINENILQTAIGNKKPQDRTYQMHLDHLNIQGFIEKRAAVVQAIYKILNTERYQYSIYSTNYGIELIDLFGKPATYVVPELQRRIEDALLYYSDIDAIDGFEFKVNKRTVSVSFTAHTPYGDIAIEKEVDF